MFDKFLKVLEGLEIKELVGGFYHMNGRCCALSVLENTLSDDQLEDLERNKENKPILETYRFYDETWCPTDQQTSMYDLLGCKELGLTEEEANELQEFNDKCVNWSSNTNSTENMQARYKKVVEFCKEKIACA